MLNQSECMDNNGTVALTGTRMPGLPRIEPGTPATQLFFMYIFISNFIYVYLKYREGFLIIAFG